MKDSRITTIKLDKSIKSRLDGLKEYKRETYNELIKKTLNIINISIRNPVAGARIFRGIKRKNSKKDAVYQDQETQFQSRPQLKSQLKLKPIQRKEILR